jgi:hypothetical protein
MAVAHHQRTAARTFGRRFGAGMLTTCGLDQFGSPNYDAGQLLPQQGRATDLPAANLSPNAVWTDHGHEISISGHLRQWRLFGEDLGGHRRISTTFGSNRLTIEDTITNQSSTMWPHMILYHLNFGYPLLDTGTTIEIVGQSTAPHRVTTQPPPASAPGVLSRSRQGTIPNKSSYTPSTPQVLAGYGFTTRPCAWPQPSPSTPPCCPGLSNSDQQPHTLTLSRSNPPTAQPWTVEQRLERQAHYRRSSLATSGPTASNYQLTPGRPTPHQFVEIYLDTGARSLQPRSQPVVRTVPAQFVAKAERGRVVIDHDQFGAGHFGQLVERLAGQGG